MQYHGDGSEFDGDKIQFVTTPNLSQMVVYK
jgi:hypothetical protein